VGAPGLDDVGEGLGALVDGLAQLPVDSGQGATGTVFETDVFDHPLQEIDARIAQIIRDNLGQGEPGIPPQ